MPQRRAHRRGGAGGAGGPESLIEFVLAADTERAALLAEAETAHDPHRIAEIHDAARRHRRACGAGARRRASCRPRLRRGRPSSGRCSEFSGGWRMRVALAAVLFAEPDLLLLDEPTNYLDLEGTLWLENYLARYPHTVLIISHDRDLLNRSVGSILHLDQGKLTLYRGGYDQFERQRARAAARCSSKLKKKQDDERQHMQAFVDRFQAKASKATQAQSPHQGAGAACSRSPRMSTSDVPPFHFPSPEGRSRRPSIATGRRQRRLWRHAPCCSDLDLRSTPTTASACSAPTATASPPSPS